jgi:hypothetical protein
MHAEQRLTWGVAAMTLGSMWGSNTWCGGLHTDAADLMPPSVQIACCMRLQHARESGAYVARELLGKQQPEYDYLPYFYSRIYDLGWEVRVLCLLQNSCNCCPTQNPSKQNPP